MPRLVSIRRKLVPGQHQELRDHIPRINHKLSDLQPKWRRLGEASVTLLQRGEWDIAVNHQGSDLAKSKPDRIANTLNVSILPMMPTVTEDMEVDVLGVDFMGKGKYPSIALLLDPEILTPERTRITHLIRRINGVYTPFQDYTPHLSIATIDRMNAEPRVLEAFQEVVPPSVKLMGAVATATS